MDAEIRQRLTDAEGDLLSALSDEILLSPFHSSWSKLQDDIANMKLQGELTEDTLTLADVVASRISMIAQCYLEMQQEQKSLMAELASGVEDILNGLDDAPTTSVSPQSNEERSSLFVKTVYNWLLENIHNPYPSTQFKASVAKTCGCSQNSVNTWFINARRRIGWTSLCREQFHNCRADALDAAYRALVRPDSSRPLPATIIQAFATIKSDADRLYASTVARSTCSKDLDAFVDAMEYGKQESTDEDNPREVTCRRKADGCTRRGNWCSETTYSSPFSSPPPPAFAIPILVPSLSDESDDEDQDVAPPVLAGRKRRASLSEDQCAAYTEHPKRLCRPSPIPSIDACVPPSPSFDEGSTVHASFETQARFVPPRSRKRRLSEGAQNNIPNRPHGLPITPRPQVVSDPLPRTAIPNESDIEDWFQTNFQALFDLPAPVECSDLDPSTQWEVLFGGYSIPSASVPSEPHLTHSPPTAVPQDVQERDFGGFDDLFLPLGNAACQDTSLGIHSSALHFSPESQFAFSDGTPSVGGVSFLDDWVTFCESTSQTENVNTHASSELGFFEFPDLSVSHPLVNNQTAFVPRDIGLPVGA